MFSHTLVNFLAKSVGRLKVQKAQIMSKIVFKSSAALVLADS